MKRFLSGFLAAVMCLGLSVVSFAESETINTDRGSVTLNVTSKETVTFKADGKTVTTTVYYAPESTPISFHVDAGEYSSMGALVLSYIKEGDDYIPIGGGQWTESMNPGLKSGQGLFSIQFPSAQGWGPEIFICSDKVKLGGKAVTGGTGTGGKASETASAPAKPAASSAPVKGDLTHEVKLGDTFGVLALNYFGDPAYWPAIYSYNAEAIQAAPGRQIYEGMGRAIPRAIRHGDKIINVIAPASAGSGEKLYTVQAGDTYGTIALSHFGDMSRYQEIFNRNSDRLKDLNTLYAGQILVLPKK